MLAKSKYGRRVLNLALSAAVGTSAMVTLVPDAGAEVLNFTSFKDIKSGDYFYEAVKSLHKKGIIKGYGEEFRPYAEVTRAQAAKIIALSLNLDTENVKDPGFKDISKSEWSYGYIAVLAEKGIVKGYGDQFKPNDPLSRAQMAKMITLAYKFEKGVLDKSPFDDIKQDDWYAEFVKPLIEHKITTGTTATAFSPNNKVTRGQIASFIFRSENAVTSKQVQSTITSVTDQHVVTATGTYLLTSELKQWINPSNAAALQGASIQFTAKDGAIDKVASVELKASGKMDSNQENPRDGHTVLDIGGASIDSDVIVNGDYITLKNGTIKGSLSLSKGVENSFFSEGLTIEGKTVISDSAQLAVNQPDHFYKSLAYKQDRSVLLAAAENKAVRQPAIVFNNTKMGEVEVTKPNIMVESTGSTEMESVIVSANITLKAADTVTIPSLTIAEGAKQLVLYANIKKVEITAKEETKLSGKGNIEHIKVAANASVSVETEGKVGKLEAAGKDVNITLGDKTKVTNLVAPEGTDPKEVIENYDKVKNNVEKVGGEKNPDAKPSTGGSSGGSNSSGGSSGGSNDDENFSLTMMHTNDTHANVERIPRRVTAVQQIREEKPNSLLLDAGDVFSGTVYFNKFEGQADLELMNYIGYDAMTFGNHEFDLGIGPLAAFVENAKFPFVSANVDFSKENHLKDRFHDEVSVNPLGSNVYSGIVKEVDGEKIGIFGLTTAETKTISSPGEHVEFEDYIEEAQKTVEQFEGMGIDKIVALTHIGYQDGGGDNDVTLAKEVEGIDVIIGGHSHDKLTAPVLDTTGQEPTVIVQANEYGKFLGVLDVEFDKGGKIVEHNGELIDIDKKVSEAKDAPYVLQEDAEAARILTEKYKPEVDAIKGTVIGTTITALDGERANVRTKETNLGNLITDGMLAKARTINPKTVIALQNGGGIRASIDQGDITLGEILTVMPFGNSLAIMELTGAEIKAALEHSVDLAPNQSGAFLHVSGLKFMYDSRKPVGERVDSVQVKEDGTNYVPLDKTKKYVVATNTFTAKGGDSYGMFAAAYAEGRVSEPGFVDWEMFRDYLTANPNAVPAVEGRIVDTAAVMSVNAAEFSGTADQPKIYETSVSVDVTDTAVLKNAVVKGDLQLKGNADVTLMNVTVDGDTIFID